jgi:hypothetical protein
MNNNVSECTQKVCVKKSKIHYHEAFVTYASQNSPKLLEHKTPHLFPSFMSE